ncbi:zinc metalloprotease [Flammeovirga kamogawensis]|uniref:Peptidase M60 domain-containing protein n=1 Tax=Flammeovirga kamogawensis TaxID=373891 RepID=A0ABX8H2F5_9BACT|nr:hypothetical protein [Flammeovirga kamogawensis]MBB6460278.1 hypothetical protein [Flammeovirga kamogawensis]QWG10089.1 hypothetical protein KM029_20620 [Flammeovirga kamogawensis]TRX65596.1 hypothetical protein EO216_24050 [Flammeovirga kamogawensis]
MKSPVAEGTNTVEVAINGATENVFFRSEDKSLTANARDGVVSLQSKKDNKPTEWQAYKTIDGKEKYVGKINVQPYEKQQYTLRIYAVNGQTLPDATDLQMYQNAVYGQALIEWTVDIKDSYDLKYSAWDINPQDDALQVGDSESLTAYTSEQKNIIKYFRDKHTKPKGKEVVLFWSPKASDEAVDGFMPLSSRYGFIFNPSNNEETYRTVAHELGHGAFGLGHTWKTLEGITKGSTANLMDYNGGLELWKWQWEILQNPAAMVSFVNEDEEGQSATVSNISKLNKFKNEDGTFTFITPSGYPITIDSGLQEVIFSTGDNFYLNQCTSGNDKALIAPIGTLLKFTVNGIEYTGRLGCSTQKFMGYKDPQGNIYADVKTEKIVDFILKDGKAIIGVPCLKDGNVNFLVSTYSFSESFFSQLSSSSSKKDGELLEYNFLDGKYPITDGEFIYAKITPELGDEAKLFLTAFASEADVDRNTSNIIFTHAHQINLYPQLFQHCTADLILNKEQFKANYIALIKNKALDRNVSEDGGFDVDVFFKNSLENYLGGAPSFYYELDVARRKLDQILTLEGDEIKKLLNAYFEFSCVWSTISVGEKDYVLEELIKKSFVDEFIVQIITSTKTDEEKKLL